MHYVNAHVARSRDASEGVHIRAVHVEKGALAVKNVGDFRDARLEDAQRGGIGNHQRGNIFGDQVAKFGDVDLTVGFGLYIFDLIAGDHGGSWICAMGGIGN